jgi:hypothetical protein
MDSIAHELRELRGEVRDLTGTVCELKTAVGDLSEGVGGAFTEARKAAEHVAALVPRVTAVETTCRERACQAATRWKLATLAVTLLGAASTAYAVFGRFVH